MPIKRTVRVFTSRYSGGKNSGRREVDEEELEIQRRLNGSLPVFGPSDEVQRVRHNLRDYQGLGQIIEGLDEESYSAFRQNYLKKASS